MSRPLKFGMRELHIEQELDDYAPMIIADMVRKAIEACKPDWKTFVLKVELDDPLRDGVLQARMTVMGEPR